MKLLDKIIAFGDRTTVGSWELGRFRKGFPLYLSKKVEKLREIIRLRTRARSLCEVLRSIRAGEWHELLYQILLEKRLLDFSSNTLEQLKLSPKRSFQHEATLPGDLKAILRTLDITPNDSIIDLGCGKGGAMVGMADFPFKLIGGVELSSGLTTIARRNLRFLGIGKAKLFCCDASSFIGFDEYNYVYMWNPFPAVIMCAVMKNLSDSLARNPRKVTIIYRNPTCHNVIVNTGMFHETKQFDHCWYRMIVYSNAAQGPTSRGGCGF